MAWFVWRRRPKSAAGRATSAAGRANTARRRPKNTWRAAIFLLSSLGFRSRCSRRAARRSRRSLFTKDRKTSGLIIAEASRCAVFLFLRGRREKGGAPSPSPAPKQEGIHPTGRRSPFGGGAGRRPPCPNGALLEKIGRVARREEAAGASRWGLGSENRPSRQWALNMGPPWPGI